MTDCWKFLLLLHQETTCQLFSFLSSSSSSVFFLSYNSCWRCFHLLHILRFLFLLLLPLFLPLFLLLLLLLLLLLPLLLLLLLLLLLFFLSSERKFDFGLLASFNNVVFYALKRLCPQSEENHYKALCHSRGGSRSFLFERAAHRFDYRLGLD